MKQYYVLYQPSDTLLGTVPLAMRFMADDREHAKEQMMDAEPDASVLFISSARNFDEALDQYWNM
jgi:hypothetical protein